jgi:hypothetical protein
LKISDCDVVDSCCAEESRSLIPALRHHIRDRRGHDVQLTEDDLHLIGRYLACEGARLKRAIISAARLYSFVLTMITTGIPFSRATLRWRAIRTTDSVTQWIS